MQSRHIEIPGSMPFLVLGLSGKTGCGKSEMRRLICEHKYPVPTVVTKVSLADPIRMIASSLFGWDGDKGLSVLPSGQIDPTKGRGLLMGIGMAMRAVYPDVWIDHAIRRITGTMYTRADKAYALGTRPPYELFVIDDLRFPNEIDRLQEEFGPRALMCRIQRDSAVDIKHVSETSLDNYQQWNYMMTNNGTIEQFHEFVKELLAGHLPY